MALTKNLNMTAKFVGRTKAVQVRKATIIKDGSDEISAPITGTFCNAVTSLVHGQTPTSAVKTHLYRRCATPCGLAQSSLPTKLLQTHKQLSNWGDRRGTQQNQRKLNHG